MDPSVQGRKREKEDGMMNWLNRWIGREDWASRAIRLAFEDFGEEMDGKATGGRHHRDRRPPEESRLPMIETQPSIP
jgi:hypothetical protein